MLYDHLSDEVQLYMLKGVTHDAVSRMVKYPSLVEFFRVGSRVEPVCLTRVKCDTGETHWCNTSCLRDGAGVIRVYSHWCYTVFYTIIKLVLILVISQEISVSYSNFELV